MAGVSVRYVTVIIQPPGQEQEQEQKQEEEEL